MQNMVKNVHDDDDDGSRLMLGLATSHAAQVGFESFVKDDIAPAGIPLRTSL